MALIDAVMKICDRLGPKGWASLLLEKHGLDITKANLKDELNRDLSGIDRTIVGFEDFCPGMQKGITAGSPARSLLYHALASSAVHPTRDGQPSSDVAAYPTLEELDTVENYIYAIGNRRVSDFTDPVIAVFAYQYRPGSRSPHGIHADMAFARTGIARVGTAPMNYDRARRSFRIIPAAENDSRLALMPARYGAFLAERRKPMAEKDAILKGVPAQDRHYTFLFPVHKLFPGNECLQGENIPDDDFRFLEYHINEKLRRIHIGNAPGRIELDRSILDFDLDKPPFLRTSADGDLVTLHKTGASRLLAPLAQKTLVRTDKQLNRATNRIETVRFVVPRLRKVPATNRSNRFETSFEIPASQRRRAAPEYVNIRHRITINRMTRTERIDDIGKLGDAHFAELIRKGGYEAAHFLDGSCDGAIRVDIRGLTKELPNFSAYSLVTCPDFLPLIDQIDVQRWADSTLVSSQLGEDLHFSQGGPTPLSDGRLTGVTRTTEGAQRIGRTPNPTLPSPGMSPVRPAFDRDDPTTVTMTAVVGPASIVSGPRSPRRANVITSFLPDAASDVFAPGWDISSDGDEYGEFYAAYGLGSPFPEDAKLCAALNSFWPAAAPDAGRTFRYLSSPTALPMLDIELGYHPDHPRVLGREIKPKRGWDGEYGPFFQSLKRQLYVNFADLGRSDYVTNALKGHITATRLSAIDNEEMIARMDALRFCIERLPPQDSVASTRLWLVSAEKIIEWSTRSDRLSSELTGIGYLYVFALVAGQPEKIRGDVRRRRWRVQDRHTCQLTRTLLFWNTNDGPSNRVARPASGVIV